MKKINRIITHYTSIAHINIVKAKTQFNSRNFEWNERLINDYLNIKQNQSNNTIIDLLHDLNQIDNNNQSALMWACEHKPYMVETLANCPEVDINQEDNDGNTALMQSLYSESNAIIVPILLRQDNIDIDIKNNHGKTALTLALEQGYDNYKYSLFYTFQDPKCNIDIVHQNGDIALKMAFKDRILNSEIINNLLNHPEIEVWGYNNNNQETLKWTCSNDYYNQKFND